MNNEDNPYVSLAELIKNKLGADNHQGIKRATIVSTSPLTITVGGLQIGADQMLVATTLLTGKEIFGDEHVLKAGDRVAVAICDQTVLLLCKVV